MAHVIKTLLGFFLIIILFVVLWSFSDNQESIWAMNDYILLKTLIGSLVFFIIASLVLKGFSKLIERREETELKETLKRSLLNNGKGEISEIEVHLAKLNINLSQLRALGSESEEVLNAEARIVEQISQLEELRASPKPLVLPADLNASSGKYDLVKTIIYYAHGVVFAVVLAAAGKIAWDVADNHYKIQDAIRLSDRGSEFYDQNNFKRSIELEESAVSIVEEALGPSSRTLALMLNNLALSYHYDGQISQAEITIERAYQIAVSEDFKDAAVRSAILDSYAIIEGDKANED